MTTIEAELTSLLQEGLAAAAPALGIDGDLPTPELLVPKQKEHGDFSTNVALMLAKRAGKPPREVASAIADALPVAPSVEKVTIAGPGFLNIFTTDAWLHDALRAIAEQGEDYGRAAVTGRRVQVEFVSANPTGPLHIGHARNAALGDALARLLEAAGETVEREYYFNDAGRQMELFGASVTGRYLEAVGRDGHVPEEGYHGAYLMDIAHDIVDAARRRSGRPSRARSHDASVGRRVAPGVAWHPAHPGTVRRSVRRVLQRGGAGAQGRDHGRSGAAA